MRGRTIFGNWGLFGQVRSPVRTCDVALRNLMEQPNAFVAALYAGIKDCRLFFLQRFFADELLVDVDAFERPAVRFCDGVQLVCRGVTGYEALVSNFV